MEWPHCELKRRVDPAARDAGGIGAVITEWREPRYRHNRSRVILARNRCGLIPQASSFIGSIHRSRSNSRRSLNFPNRRRVKSSRLKKYGNTKSYYVIKYRLYKFIYRRSFTQDISWNLLAERLFQRFVRFLFRTVYYFLYNLSCNFVVLLIYFN